MVIITHGVSILKPSGDFKYKYANSPFIRKHLLKYLVTCHSQVQQSFTRNMKVCVVDYN